jgi:hypothetical protein
MARSPAVTEREATAELMRHRHESIAHALEMAIRRAYALGRVDESIGWAAEELRRMVEADPGITPEEVVRLYGEQLPPRRWSNIYDWDRALWCVAEVWCVVYRRLQGRPARKLPASPYSVLHPDEAAAWEAARP